MAVAVTGAIGAGKSEALRAFERHGAAVLSSDEIVHELLGTDPEVRAAVLERFGDEVLEAGGSIDRSRVAGIVFSRPADLEWLEELLHPRVFAEFLRWRDELEDRDDAPGVCVAEIPLLFEAGAEESFDAVVVVTAPADVRAGRLGREPAERERRLIPDEAKVARADFAYVNDRSLAELDAFVSDVVARLTGR